MKKLSHRPGDVAPHSGARGTVNLDQGTRDRLTWAEQFAKRVLQADAGQNVLIRRAVRVYIRHLERLVKKNEQGGEAAKERLQGEAYALRSATRGEQDAIPEADLIAVPVKLFSEMQRHG